MNSNLQKLKLACIRKILKPETKQLKKKKKKKPNNGKIKKLKLITNVDMI